MASSELVLSRVSALALGVVNDVPVIGDGAADDCVSADCGSEPIENEGCRLSGCCGSSKSQYPVP